MANTVHDNTREIRHFRHARPTAHTIGTLQGRNISCCCDPISSRLKAIGSLVGQLITLTVQATYDLIPTTLSLISCGHFCDHQEAGSHVMRENLTENMSELFECILHVVNPEAEFESRFSCYEKIDPIENLAFEMSRSENPFPRHVTARALYLVEFVGGLVLRVADLAIGLLATPCAILTLGYFPTLNGKARDGFEALGGIIGDTIRFVAMMISPRIYSGRRPPTHVT